MLIIGIAVAVLLLCGAVAVWLLLKNRRQLQWPVVHFEELKLMVAELEPTEFRNIRMSDISREVQEVIARSGVRHGEVLVQTSHTTTMLTRLLEFRSPFSRIATNENEVGLVRHDLPLSMQLFMRILKFVVVRMQDREWQHDRKERLEVMPGETANAPSHILNFLLGRVSEKFIVRNGKIWGGRWQDIQFWDLDPLGRIQQGILYRTVGVQVSGIPFEKGASPHG